MKKLLFLSFLLFPACHRAHQITGGDSKSDADAADTMTLVACCRDNMNGVLSYPAFVPPQHAQFCETVRRADKENNGHLNGGLYLAMNVDCEKSDRVGSEYYAGRGY